MSTARGPAPAPRHLTGDDKRRAKRNTAAMRRRTRLLPLALLLALASCTGTRRLVDPIIEVTGPGGAELGVSTEYGIVFLGNRTRAGDIDVTAFFGDGPSIESTVAEPVGGGLYTAELDIRLPWVPLTFRSPRPGERVKLMGRWHGGRAWSTEVRVASDPRVDGLLLGIPRELANAPDQIGTGVFIVGEEEHELALVGLVSGRIAIGSGDDRRQYLTVVGPDDLWRLVSYRRTDPRDRRWVYREDIL